MSHNKQAVILLKSMIKSSLSLGFFSILTVGLIAVTYVLTAQRITTQTRNFEAMTLKEVIPDSLHDNILLDTTIMLPPSKLLATQKEQKAYIAFQRGTPAAIILPTIAPDGYNGRIVLLVGININGVLTGVRVITQNETPGLGDKIETSISNWIVGFTGKSINNPTSKRWAVKKDGGQFDQFTGATITPRAVVSAVYRALEYFSINKSHLLNKNILAQDQKNG